MVIIIPACVCVIEKVWAISVKSPMGINSDVLKINAAIVIPISGIHCFLFINNHPFKNVFYFSTTLVENPIFSFYNIYR